MLIKRRARPPRVPLPLQCRQVRIEALGNRIRRDAQCIRGVTLVSGELGRCDRQTGILQVLDLREDGCFDCLVREGFCAAEFDVFDVGDERRADKVDTRY